jgi:3-oxoacyl-[acyl-carrier-protein] synthase II
MTSPDPVGKGILKSMTNALRQAHCSSVSIDWVHAHGTGSFANDLAEANALHEFFESSSPPVTSTKAVHGHALGISGLLETQLCVESLQREILLPTMNCQEVDSKIRVPILRVKESRPTLRRILKTTLGFGGVNAALVLGKMEPL